MSTSLPSDICFVISTSNPILHKSVNNKLLIKETNISKHLHHKEPLVPYSESDTTRRLHHTEPLVRHVEIYTKSDTTVRLYETEALLWHVEMYTKVGTTQSR